MNPISLILGAAAAYFAYTIISGSSSTSSLLSNLPANPFGSSDPAAATPGAIIVPPNSALNVPATVAGQLDRAGMPVLATNPNAHQASVAEIQTAATSLEPGDFAAGSAAGGVVMTIDQWEAAYKKAGGPQPATNWQIANMEGDGADQLVTAETYHQRRRAQGLDTYSGQTNFVYGANPNDPLAAPPSLEEQMAAFNAAHGLTGLSAHRRNPFVGYQYRGRH